MQTGWRANDGCSAPAGSAEGVSTSCMFPPAAAEANNIVFRGPYTSHSSELQQHIGSMRHTTDILLGILCGHECGGKA